MNERMREQLEALDPDRRAKVEAAIARTQTPERRAGYAAARERFADRPGPDELHARGEIDAEARDRLNATTSLAHIAQALRCERERLGLSLADLARATGSERGAVHKIEAGTNPNPTVGTLDRLARALGKRLVITLEDAPGTAAVR